MAGLLLLTASLAQGQYPGRVTKSTKAEPVLRSVAVLEWVGEPGKPAASRLVPVTVYDGEQLNDGTIYLSRPEPMALAGGVEYELQMAGKPIGLFDIFQAGETDGAWRGFGVWKPMTAAARAKASEAFNTSSLNAGVSVIDDDKPVLKRKHPKGTDTDDAPKSSPDTASATAPAKPPANPSTDADPDRPTLKRKGGDDSATSSGTTDPDRPNLKRKTSEDTAGTTASDAGKGTGAVDPDRPTIRRSRKNAAEDSGMLETSLATPDPDRPRLKRGKPEDSGAAEPPKLEGAPATMQQAVAVSDASNHAEHPWKYSWANPEDELKMKDTLEAIARTALGLDPPAAPARPAKKTAAGRKVAKPAPPAPPVELADVQFRVFELSYGATATLVYSASTPAPALPQPEPEQQPELRPVISRGKKTVTSAEPPPAPAAAAVKPAPQKFVTIIAQPDLYGGVLVLHKSVTDSAHLDQTPRMRLVDAVDAMGDNRGELLFELRGDTQRQFALYRVMRGSAEQLFATISIP